jgi:hypothetical protein
VSIPGSWNQDFASAMTVDDDHDSVWEYHKNDVAKGGTFKSSRHLLEAIIKWAMSTHRQFKTIVSSRKYLKMECVDINYPGRVHGYIPKFNTTWRVRDFLPYTCVIPSIRQDHRNLSPTLIAQLL